jgi:hypothetical protein
MADNIIDDNSDKKKLEKIKNYFITNKEMKYYRN